MGGGGVGLQGQRPRGRQEPTHQTEADRGRIYSQAGFEQEVVTVMAMSAAEDGRWSGCPPCLP